VKPILGDSGTRNEVGLSSREVMADDFGCLCTVLLSDDDPTNRWEIVCSVDTAHGRFVVGRIRTIAPGGAFAGLARVVALLYVPGAIGWYAEAFRYAGPTPSSGSLGLCSDRRANGGKAPLTVMPGAAAIVVPNSVVSGGEVTFV